MGTIGGNVLLDARCLFFNQTLFWRKALGYCKAEGTWCRWSVVETCVATQSSDTVPVFSRSLAHSSIGPNGSRELDLRSLYKFNGMDHLQIERATYHRIVVHDPAGFAGAPAPHARCHRLSQLGVRSPGFAGDGEQARIVSVRSPATETGRRLDAFLGNRSTTAVRRSADGPAADGPQGSVRNVARAGEWPRLRRRGLVRCAPRRNGEVPPPPRSLFASPIFGCALVGRQVPSAGARRGGARIRGLSAWTRRRSQPRLLGVRGDLGGLFGGLLHRVVRSLLCVGRDLLGLNLGGLFLGLVSAAGVPTRAVRGPVQPCSSQSPCVARW
jgi:hypothetical protein